MSKIIGGSAFGRGDALIDTDKAVLLGNVHVAIIGAARQTGVETVIGLELSGRVNHSTDEHEHLYLMDADGAAAIISDLLGLAGRANPRFLAMLLERIENLPKEQP
ncbi:hypothetical protein [Microbacterium maritypicum]